MYRFLSLTAVVLLCACAVSKPSRYYTLSPISAAQGNTKHSKTSPVITLRTVNFPGYLSTPQMVVRRSENELELQEFERWGEELKTNFERTLAENLSLLLDSSSVYNFPLPDGVETNQEILVDVYRFEIDHKGVAELKARWSIGGLGGMMLVPARATTISEVPAGSDFSAYSAALSKTVAGLAQEIAAGLARDR